MRRPGVPRAHLPAVPPYSAGPAGSLAPAPVRPWEIYRGAGDTPALTPGPAFSVVMPLHNMAHRGLERAIESVLGQTCADWELLLVDDDSTDGGGRVAEWYAARDPRLRYRRQANRGLPATRNAAYWLARGEFVAHLDPDDEYLPHTLATQLQALVRNPHAGAAFGPALRGGRAAFNYGQEAPPADGWSAVSERCLTPCQSVVLRRSLLQAVGGNDVGVPCLRHKAQDWEQWTRAFAVTEAVVQPEPLYILHTHPDSQTATAGGWGPAADAEVLRRLARLIPAREALRSRPLRVFMTGLDAYSRGAQVMLLSLIEHLPPEVEVTLALGQLAGELLDRYRAVCEVIPWNGDAVRRAQAADVVHHHFYGWRGDPDLLNVVPSERLVVTEHSALCRYEGPGRAALCWATERPDLNADLPAAFTPARVEIPNPMDLPRADPRAAAALGIPEGPLVLGLIPAQHYKGVDLWLDAAEAAFRRRPELVFALVGFRAAIDENFAAATARIERLRAAGMRISWHPPQPRPVVSALCRRAAVLLHLPRTEALGLVLLEAQAAGTPVVCSAVGGTRQAVQCGRVTAPDCPAAAARAVLDLVRKRVPRPVRECLRWRHEPRRVAASYAELYRWVRLQTLLNL